MREPLWQPDPKKINKTYMWKFLELIQKKYDSSIQNYKSLHQWSVKNPDFFWREIFDASQVIHSRSYKEVMNKIATTAGVYPNEGLDQESSAMQPLKDGKPGTQWFSDAKLNFAENLLRYRDDHTALIYENEEGFSRKISYAQLFQEVQSYATYLRELGVTVGDRVASLLPNCIENVVAMLATTSLGSIWSSCSPDFGVQGILDRFSQIEPKVLFVKEAYIYGGKSFDIRDKIKKVAEKISTRLIVIPRNTTCTIEEGKYQSGVGPCPGHQRSTELQRRACALDDRKNAQDSTKSSISFFEQLPFDHPIYILYSSGTTGVPKCIVHGAGGTLLQHFKELKLHTNIDRSDTVFYYTTCGWMMWNWLVSSLYLGASVVLYDGSAVHPAPNRLWQLATKHKVTVFGASPKYFSACEKSALSLPGEQSSQWQSNPKNKYDLSSLRCILSTGSPLPAEQFDWIYQNIKEDIQLSSICGGTDIVSCFMLGNPILPVYRGEIQCLGLGMDVRVYNEEGQEEAPTHKGELVCATPFPSMPVGFWNDPQGEKYFKAYFDYFPGVWRHGDFIKITEHGGVIVYGRSDSTLNPGGVRIGTSEIYRVVEAHPDVIDSVVVGHEVDNDVEIILFVVLRKDKALTEEFKKELAEKIKQEASPRHKPRKIFQVSDIPRTLSGKKVELAISNVIHGREVKNKEALANPQALDQFKKINLSS
ncbi:MAG: acetoacetate--CoA ligase [Deltaproteobacteria bacterium]|nr:acetoacetate--CoA ligase [Deltaproteobacteria bacterium]